MAGLLGFGNTADVIVFLNEEEDKKKIEYRLEDGTKTKLPLFYDGDNLSGRVKIHVKSNKLQHSGVQLEFVGQIMLLSDKSNPQEFTSLVRQLSKPGELSQGAHEFPYEFLHVEKPFESFYGVNVRLRYFLRVTIEKRFANIVKEKPIAVQTLHLYPETDQSSLKMEVGIEDCLHIEFEYNKQRYHLRDVILGKIYFLLVRVKIKHMQIDLIRKEITGAGNSGISETETVTKYEIMDGAPVKGECIPIRFFLGAYELTPTMKDINKKFSVRYYINLVLLDEDDRRYFKQQEVILWRKQDKTKKNCSGVGLIIGGGTSTDMDTAKEEKS
ncbi:Vacuolar protein sorting-associated protein 26B [Oopsacas minuta]|uniref:Vacuolar protein sorting-associated protein 26B n=1 Tax=Oopsacas minuta TaxID=111878 RepID=A0AAV7JZP0_9METZ|nr:Vacuolar protein sorting-associated protein 26B [Oopsacas minuta]